MGGPGSGRKKGSISKQSKGLGLKTSRIGGIKAVEIKNASGTKMIVPFGGLLHKRYLSKGATTHFDFTPTKQNLSKTVKKYNKRKSMGLE